MELNLFRPEVAFRDCVVCQDVLFYEAPDDNAGEMVMRGGKPVKRHAKLPPPCRTKIGCKKGTPENPKSLSEKNQQAYQHYRECRAVGVFPDDPIVTQNAAVIRGLEDMRERRDDLDFQQLLTTIVTTRV